MRAFVAARVRQIASRPAWLMGSVLFVYFLAYVLVWALLHRSTRETTLDTLNMVGALLGTLYCAWAAHKTSET